MDELNARNLRKHGMERGAYNGANKRRFVLFVDEKGGGDLSRLKRRHEFDSARERDDYARRLLQAKREPTGAIMPDGTKLTTWDERLRAAGGSPTYD